MAKTVSKLGEEGKVSIRFESGNCMATVTPQPYSSNDKSSKSSLEATVWCARQTWNSSVNVSVSVNVKHLMQIVGISTWSACHLNLSQQTFTVQLRDIINRLEPLCTMTTTTALCSLWNAVIRLGTASLPLAVSGM